MKWMVITAGLMASAALLPAPAQAAGCVKGAIVGGVAGHYAGQHGWLGAGAGCLIGRHMANKHERENYEMNRRYERY